MYYLKYKDILVEDIYRPNKPIGQVGYGIMGEYRAMLYSENGILLEDTGWKRNLITESGMSLLAYSNQISIMKVGDSAVAPQITDTDIGNLLGSASMSTYSEANGGSPNYECITTYKARFNAGVATGTIREMSLHRGNTSSPSPDAVVHTAITPNITKSSSQILDVYWRFTGWPDLAGMDVTGVVNIEGEDFNYWQLPCEMQKGDNLLWAGLGNPTTFEARTNVTDPNFDNGITLEPVGDYINPQPASLTSVAKGYGYNDSRAFHGLDYLNHANGIQAIVFNPYTDRTSAYDQGIKVLFRRVSDNAGIPKDNTRQIWFDFRVSWTRVP